VIAVRREFENLKTIPPLLPHQSVKAGTLIWARSLLLRLRQPFDQFSAAESWLPYFNSKDETIASSRGIITSIQEFIKNTFSEFHRKLTGTLQQMPSHPVLIKPCAQSLRCNMEAAIVIATEKEAHLLHMDYEISKIALELTQVRERNRLSSESVLLVVRDYDTIYDCL
jgi:hypothetical protein